MNTHYFKVFEVQSSYYYSSMVGDVLAKDTLTITDDDNSFDRHTSQDSGGNQTFDFADEGDVSAYKVQYLDYAQVDGSGPEYELYTIKVRFESGDTKFYVMSKDDVFDPSVGDSLAVTSFSDFNYTTFQEIEAAVCFTHGTRISTPTGAVNVERLTVGDLVLSMDHGPLPIRWIGRRQVPRDTLWRRPELAPVHFPAGQIGNDRALVVSPQHRLLAHDRSPSLTGLPKDTLISARHASKFLGTGYVPRPARAVLYVHLLFDRHALIWADGAICESMYLGPMVRDGLSKRAMSEVETLFPDLRPLAPAPFEAARPFLDGRTIRDALGKAA